MSLAAFARARAPVPSPFSRRTIPFDYHFHFKVFDEKKEDKSFIDELLTSTVTISVEASFTAVSIGYGLLPRQLRIPFGPSELEDVDVPPPAETAQAAAAEPAVAVAPDHLKEGSRPRLAFDSYSEFIHGRLQTRSADSVFAEAELTLNDRLNLFRLVRPEERRIPPTPPRNFGLGDVFNSLGRVLGEGDFAIRGQMGPRTVQALKQGFRLNPAIANAILLSDGRDPVDADMLAELFETIEPLPERVQFLYSLRDEGTGREFMSEYQLSTAGLGGSDGQRPFRYFAVPITFSPRSTIRLNIIPKSEFKGELYVVLNGYKILGGAGTPTGRRLRPRRAARRFRSR
jgi:hypothetical protein